MNIYIPSKDVRNYITEINYIFNDLEKATLIYNNNLISNEEKKKAIQEVYNHSIDNDSKKRIMDSLIGEGELYDYVHVPHPFKVGDIVRIVGKDVVGVIETSKDSGELYSDKIAQLDYSDSQLLIDTYYDGDEYLSNYAHEHVNPIYIEYANLSDSDHRKGYLEYIAQSHLKYSLFTSTGRTINRIPAIIYQLEKVWRNTPDLRLGQLLVNVSGKDNLFYMEDHLLMERLQACLDLEKEQD